MNKELCLQQRIGSCLGCPVLEIAVGKARVSRVEVEQKRIADGVGKVLCPEKVEIIIPNILRGKQGRLISQR